MLSLARSNQNDDLQLDTRTRGKAYGLELLFHRDLSRRLGGFLAYTLSRSERSLPLGLGQIPSSFDRTHVLNAALGYDLGGNFRAGGRFVFYTGNPPFASSSGISLGGERLPAFHRLDLRLEKRWPFAEAGGFSALVLEVLNSTLGSEVVSRDCDSLGCHDQAIGPVTIPSLSFEGRF